jgi:4'-phosphopantetheinyl transferase
MLILREGKWSEPPAELSLCPNAPHVWRVDLRVDDERVRGLHEILSDEERERAGRLVMPVHRRRFVVTRGLLRTLLACYASLPAREIPIDSAGGGKPRLLGSPQDADLRFNVSHSEDSALFVLSLDREVGIDLEHIRPLRGYTRIAERNFTRREFEQISALPACERLRGFFSCWTRKEAYVKARGDGLLYPLDVFQVSVSPDQPALLIENFREPAEVFRWSMRNVDLGSDIAAALVVERGPARSQRMLRVNGLPVRADGPGDAEADEDRIPVAARRHAAA